MNEILDLNQKIMERAEGQLLRSIEEVEKELYTAVRRVLLSFETKGGYFVPDEARLQVINELKKEVKKILSRSALKDEFDSFFAEFDKIGDNMIAFHQGENGISVPKQLVNEQKKFIINQTIESVFGAGADARFVDPIKRALFNHVNFGSSVLDAEKDLRNMILGEGDKAGVLNRWVGQVARDSIQQYEGGINARVAVDYELKYFRYVGSLVEDSRPQCVRWVNMGSIAVEDLPAEIAWARANGSGMYSGTTPAMFAVHRGGYNCRHTAYPTNNPGPKPDPIEPPGKKPSRPAPTKKAKPKAKPKEKPASFVPGSQPKPQPNVVQSHANIPDDYAAVFADATSPNMPKEFWDQFLSKVKIRKAVGNEGSFARGGKEVVIKVKGRWEEIPRKIVAHEFGHILHDQHKIFNLLNEDSPEWFTNFWEKARRLAGQDIRGATKELRDRRLAEILRKVSYEDAVADPFLARAGTYERARVAKKYNLELGSSFEKESWAAFNDTIGALTRNKFGWGHENAYYAKRRGWPPSSGTYFQKAEVFAHAMEARWFADNPYTKELLPELYELMLKMVDDFEKHIAK